MMPSFVLRTGTDLPKGPEFASSLTTSSSCMRARVPKGHARASGAKWRNEAADPGRRLVAVGVLRERCMVHRHAAGPVPERMRLLAGVVLITVAAGDHHGNGGDSCALPHPPRDAPLSAGPCMLPTILTCGCVWHFVRTHPSRLQRTCSRLLHGLADVLMVTHQLPTAGQAVYPVMPDCTSLQPTPCEILPNVTADGTIDYKTGYFVRHDCCRTETGRGAYLAWSCSNWRLQTRLMCCSRSPSRDPRFCCAGDVQQPRVRGAATLVDGVCLD